MSAIANTSNTAAATPPSQPPYAVAQNHSPRHSEQSRRKENSSPWAQIVRGELEMNTAAPSSPTSAPPSAVVSTPAEFVVSVSGCSDEEGVENGSENVGKRPVWKKPVNGASDLGRVMDGSWPALAESARSSAKSSSESLKGLSDGSSSPLLVSVSQGAGTASTPMEKQIDNFASSNSTPNNTISARQRPMKRNVANTFANGGASQTSGSQDLGEVDLNSSSSRDLVQRNSQPRGGADQPQQRNSFRNRNGGPHSRGDNSHWGRRDQDRGNQDWNSQRNFNGRDAHMPNQRFMPRNVRHPHPQPQPTSSQYFQPQPVRPFVASPFYSDFMHPMYYVAAPLPDSMGGVPYSSFYPPQDLELRGQILYQINYYFSMANLVKDTFLRQNMDDQGWVPIKLIAGFKKISQLTDNIQLILDVVRTSAEVEVQDDKVRKRDDWMRWVMPPSVKFPNVSAPQSPGNSGSDMLATSVWNLSLDERNSGSNVGRRYTDVNSEAFLSRSTSGNSIGHTPVSLNEEIGHASK